MNGKSSRGRAKAVILVIVVAIHIGAIVTFEKIKSRPIEFDQGPHTEFFFIAPDRSRKIPDDLSRQRTNDSERDHFEASVPPSITSDTPQSTAPTDWEEQGRRAATALAESKQ